MSNYPGPAIPVPVPDDWFGNGVVLIVETYHKTGVGGPPPLAGNIYRTVEGLDEAGDLIACSRPVVPAGAVLMDQDDYVALLQDWDDYVGDLFANPPT